VAHAFSPIISVVTGGIGTLLVVGTWSLLFPTLRRYGALKVASADEHETVIPASAE
jgi:hypothetical protein